VSGGLHSSLVRWLWKIKVEGNQRGQRLLLEGKRRRWRGTLVPCAGGDQRAWQCDGVWLVGRQWPAGGRGRSADGPRWLRGHVDQKPSGPGEW
jgi:hypothetical protein